MDFPIDCSGVWKYDWADQVIDTKAVQLDASASMKIPHGTYTRIRYFVIHMLPGVPAGDPTAERVENQVLHVYDEEGNLGRFLHVAQGIWHATDEAVTFSLPDGHQCADVGVVETVLPSLVIEPFTAEEMPADAVEAADGSCPWHVRALSDAAAGRSRILEQRIRFEPSIEFPDDVSEGSLYWMDGQGNRLHFVLCSPQTPADATERFDDVFKGDTKLAQISLPYLGFDPIRMRQYDSGAAHIASTDPGSPRTTSNAGQSFNGRLIFAFPKPDSRDFVRSMDLADNPFLPVGLIAKASDVGSGGVHTSVISSTSDRLASWELTLGLSAGVKNIFSVQASGSHAEKLQEQLKLESRYVVSRNISARTVLMLDLPSLSLHPSLRAKILSITKKIITPLEADDFDYAMVLQREIDADWQHFLTLWGTHYAHALTQGGLAYSETRMTLRSEVKAQQQKIDIKAKASLSAGKLGFSANSAYANEWSVNHGLEVSSEDVVSHSVGEHTPMTIYFDLRPITELLSPLFFPYNAADPLQSVAPFVWRRTRQSLIRYLQAKQAKAEGAAYLGGQTLNFTPRKISATLTGVEVVTSSVASRYAAMVLVGPLALGGLDGNDLIASSVDMPKADPSKWVGTQTSTFVPTTDGQSLLTTTVAAASGSKVTACITVSCDIAVIGLMQRDGSNPGPIAQYELKGLALELQMDPSATSGQALVSASVSQEGKVRSKSTPPKVSVSTAGDVVRLDLADTQTGVTTRLALKVEDEGLLWQ